MAFAFALGAQTTTPGTTAPLDWRLRASLYARTFITYQSVLDTAPAIAFNHTIVSPESWGGGTQGLYRRIGSTYAQYAVRETIELAMFAVHKEDPRYVRQGRGPVLRRAAGVLKSAVIVRDLNGGQTLAAGAMVGVFGARAIAVAWLPPEEQTGTSVLVSGSYGLLTRAAGNAVHEFWPDIWRRIRR